MGSFLQTKDKDRQLQGVVFRKTAGHYLVQTNGRMIACTLATPSRQRQKGSPSQHTSRDLAVIAVGDVVQLIEYADHAGQIVEVLPRRSQISRRAAKPMPGSHQQEQVIVANVDQVIPVFAAAQPTPRWHLLDRYLVTAEAAQLPAVICLTKMDLAEQETSQDKAYQESLDEVLENYEKVGYQVIQVSVVTGEGLVEMKRALQGRTSVLLGKSGVGKSSLLNALQPGLGLRVNEVSRVSGGGKHTTTNQEMFPLDWGGVVVDTAGIREFGLWDIDEDELAMFFPEIRPFIGQCRFGLDCQHDEEPDCAVRKAVMRGDIHPRRYQSYMHMKQDDD